MFIFLPFPHWLFLLIPLNSNASEAHPTHHTLPIHNVVTGVTLTSKAVHTSCGNRPRRRAVIVPKSVIRHTLSRYIYLILQTTCHIHQTFLPTYQSMQHYIVLKKERSDWYEPSNILVKIFLLFFYELFGCCNTILTLIINKRKSKIDQSA